MSPTDQRTLTVPAAVAAAIDRFDQSADPCCETDVSSAIAAVRPPSDQVGAAENLGAWTELLAFALTPTVLVRDNPWNTYFGPNGWGEDSEGRRVYFPSLNDAGPECIEHWAQRSEAVRNPILRARYADLCWDLGRLLTGKRVGIAFAHRAIDAYLEADGQRRHPDVMRQFPAIRRALRLAVQIQDLPRRDRDRARAALLALHSGQMERVRGGQRGSWWMAFREMQDNKAAGFTEAEQTQLVQDVESVFELRRLPGEAQRFDPHDARDAAEALIRHYRSRQRPEEIKRLQQALARCLEHFASCGDAMLAASILPDCVDLYREAGLPQEARRVQRHLQDKIRDSRALMGQHEFVQKVPKEEMDAWLAAQVDGGLDATLVRIAESFAVRETELRQQIADTAKSAPLFSMLTKTLHAEDHVAGSVGDAAGDETGSLLFEASRALQFNSFWLFHALDHALQVYGIDAADLVARVNASGLFDDDTVLLEKGIRAWIDGDPLQAVHLLIPQIERAVRGLMHKIGQPVTKPHREVEGASQSIGIGDALHSAEFATAYGPDLRLHLMALYADPRGWNLRNRMAHGTLRANDIDAGTAAWLIQTLVLLSVSASRIAPNTAPAASP